MKLLTFSQCYADNILEPQGEVLIAGLILDFGLHLNIFYAVQGEVDDEAIAVYTAYEIPSAVILLQQVGVEKMVHHLLIIWMVFHPYYLLVADDVEQQAYQIGILQIWCIGKAEYLRPLFKVKADCVSLQKLEMLQAIELTKRAQHFIEQATFLT